MDFKWKTPFAEETFHNKYAQGPNDTWPELARRVVEDVCGSRWGTDRPLMSKEDRDQLTQYIKDMKFIPGGRYLYYAGRPAKFFNNCFALKAEEDSREEWGNLTNRAMSCLMSGGGIGVDLSIIRPSGRTLSRTGGISSGPVPLAAILNEVGRNVMQGGSRRSAIWCGLNWQHEDVGDFINAKNWSQLIRDIKAEDFNFPAPLDMTNISVQFDTEFANQIYCGPEIKLETERLPNLWYDVVRRLCKTGEPGLSFNFWKHESEICRNACTEFISDRDSDVCNLGSVNLGNIGSIGEFEDVVKLASAFLVCGTVRADLPYDKVRRVREDARKIGLGLMGVHEWLLLRGKGYEVDGELRAWLEVYAAESRRSARHYAQSLFISEPIRFRAIAPAGTIGILASTTTGIEPLFAVAYKRRYLTNGTKWKYQYVIDATAERILNETGKQPEDITTAYRMSESLEGIEQRVRFQYEIQKYVDLGISSTINMDSWGTQNNNDDIAKSVALIIAKYAHGLRGITCYPNGGRGGQPLKEVDFKEARRHHGVVFDEEAMKGCVSGVCGI